MTVNGWVRLMWEDEKLTWNPSDYGGLATLHLADHEIWEPDVVLYNSAVGNNVDHYGNTHCLAYPNGRILWVPPAQFSFFCDMDLTRWPFDTHTCSMKLGSWTYSGEQLDLQTDETRVDVKVVVSEWDVVDVTKKRSSTYYACCTEPYVDIEFNVTVKRHSPSYHAVVINPAIGKIYYFYDHKN
ncbi:hypothetical protein AAG570_003497 [Ranatra chinensis]|uniref:Neurotransmitter-gated ion-channel ligand-binding domain-containing protein n=1 Tax=Ranatra chinensis TaxID=642074 RepID=A0ABD0Y4I0_9HEMI